jgi:DNA-binding GntR family transcriptional regulator
MGNPSFVAIRAAALRRDVADVLRSAILDGRFQPGEELSDYRLAADLAVSRGPVREALLVLAEEGLVLHRQNRGFGIPRLDRSDLEKISAVRQPLEVLALEQARARVTAADIDRLAHLKDELLAAFREGGIKVCARPDLAFHASVWEMAGNEWLSAALKRVSLPYFAYVSAFNLGRRDQSVGLMEEMHIRYLDYLARRGTESAADCVTFHLGLGV